MKEENDIAIKVSGLSKRYHIGEQSLSEIYNPFSFFKKRKEKKTKDEFYALKNVSFEIKKGEAVGIIGRNGAGKSTLLKILSRITEPTEGRIEINGTIASVLEVGMGFHPELTGRENVYLSGTMLGIPKKKIAEKFNEIVEFAEVQKFIDTPVKHYSSGMYVRLAFSVVANVDADILLFDEVLSVGDLAFQMKCTRKIKELVNKKKTILLVSHSMNDIQRLCRKVVYIERGRIAQQGNIDVIREYFEESYANINEDITQKNTNSLSKFSNIVCKKWENQEAPGDKFLKITRFYIERHNSDSEQQFLSNRQITIAIEYEKFDNDSFYDFGIIMSNMSNPLICSQTINSNIKIEEIKEKGCYYASVTFEPYFFNETILEFGLSIIANNNSIVYYDFNILRCKIELSIREHEIEYFKNLPKFNGPLRPKCNWQLKRYY